MIKNRTPAHKSASDELAELLSVSKDSAYRRLRNETPFTLDETVKICLHFDISPAALLERTTELIPFKYNQLYEKHDSFLHYIQNMTGVIAHVTQMNGSIVYAAEDVPIFRHFNYPHLAAFKLFYWSKAVLNSETYTNRKFSPDLIHPDIMDAAKQLNKAYSKVTSTEIWTQESINSSLRQIEYFAESGQFEHVEDAMKVLDDFDQMLEELQQQAEISQKDLEVTTGERNFTLYNSEVLIGNNSILIEGLEKPMVFISHNTFNSLMTRDRSFCEETRKWMNNLVRKSTLISDVSEKHRYNFFRTLRNATESSKEKVDRVLS